MFIADVIMFWRSRGIPFGVGGASNGDLGAMAAAAAAAAEGAPAPETEKLNADINTAE